MARHGLAVRALARGYSVATNDVRQRRLEQVIAAQTARAYGLLQILHPTDPGYEVAHQAYLEEAAKVRAARRR